MQIIHKYELMSAENKVEMPAGAHILCVQSQHERPCLWAIVDPNVPKEIRTFHMHMTGEVSAEGFKGEYVGTIQLADGIFVGHIFDATQSEKGKKT